MEKITKVKVEQKQKKLLRGLSKEMIDFMEKSNKFLKENDIKPKEFSYQSGLSFGSYNHKSQKPD